MQKMDNDLASLDIRALSFLQNLLQTGSVTRTGELLGISQPAASRMLARIRDLIGDPLLIRTQNGYQLTDHALSLQGPVLEAITALRLVFSKAEFDPGISEMKYQLACTDYAVACVVGPVMRRLAEIAPKISVEVLPLVPESFAMLDKGEIDFVLYATLNVKGDFIGQKLYDEGYALVLRKGHPLIDRLPQGGALEPEDLVGYPQIEFAYSTQVQLRTDPILRAVNDVASSTLSIPFFTAMPFIILDTDTVALVPGRFAALLSNKKDIVTVPYRPNRRFPYHLIWHERARHNPAIGWFVRQVMAAVK